MSQVEQEPGLVCCGGGALFVVATGGCKVIFNFINHNWVLFFIYLCFCSILTVCWCDVLNWTQVEAYSVEREGCPLICRFATMGTVKSIQHSKIGKEKFPPSFHCQQQLHEYQYAPVAVCLFYMWVSQLIAGELPCVFFVVINNNFF